VLELALIRSWLNRRTPRSKRAAQVGLLLAVALPTIQALVVTQRERIDGICGATVRAVQAGDVPGVAVHVAAEFREGDIDRELFLRRVKDTLTTYKVDHARVLGLDISVHGETAEAVLRVVCTVVTRDELLTNTLTAWDVRFRRRDGTWQMVGVRPRPTPQFPFDRLEQIIR
jgi:hypothetical protein